MCSLESGVLYRESVVWGGGKAAALTMTSRECSVDDEEEGV